MRQTELADFAELPESYIRLQGMVETQYGAVKIVSNTWSALIERPTCCDLCRSLDGKTLPEGHPDFEAYQPPLHDRCHCVWIGSTTESPYKPSINWKTPDKKLVEKFANFVGILPEKDLPHIIPMPKKLSEEEWLRSLTDEEREAIISWSSEYYGDIRLYQQLGKFPAKWNVAYKNEIERYTTLLEKTLDRAEPYKDMIFRGIGDIPTKDFSKLISAKNFEWNALASASVDESLVLNRYVLVPKAKNGILFRIRNKTGVRVYNVFIDPGEKEVIMRRGAKYRVISTKEIKKNFYVMDLEEL